MAEIRKFADAGLQKSIDEALAGLPPGQKGAVVAIADGDEALLAVVGRIGDQWSVVGQLTHPWKGKLDGQVAVRFTW